MSGTLSLLLGTLAVAGALAAEPTRLAVKRGERLLVVAPTRMTRPWARAA